MPKLRKDNTSGVTGVNYRQRINSKWKLWEAEITVNYKGISLEFYDTIEEAIQARRAAESKYNNSNANEAGVPEEVVMHGIAIKGKII